MDLRDCNLLGSAVGDLASQRAYIRATSISCVNSKGKAFDVKLEAYAVSENDGKMGSEARLSAEMVTQLQELHLPVDFLHLPVAKPQ